MKHVSIFNTPLFIERDGRIARPNQKHALEKLCQT